MFTTDTCLDMCSQPEMSGLRDSGKMVPARYIGLMGSIGYLRPILPIPVGDRISEAPLPLYLCIGICFIFILVIFMETSRVHQCVLFV